jgi:uncharacterized membrane protein HdeD (DUF308 family)
MIVKTAAMLILLLGAAIIAALGVWFAFNMHKGWLDARSGSDDGEPGWMIFGALGLIACAITLIGLAYNLASGLG